MADVIKTYRQRMPATRFIGKKYGDEDRVNGLFVARWVEWHRNGWFADIEKAPGFNSDFMEDAGAYIGMMRQKNGEHLQYWIGMFTPPGTAVPKGMSYMDLPASTLGVCWVYGPEPDVCGKDNLVMEAFQKNGIAPATDADGAHWFFERYACPRFTEPDEKGCVILDYCCFITD